MQIPEFQFDVMPFTVLGTSFSGVDFKSNQKVRIVSEFGGMVRLVWGPTRTDATDVN